MKLLVLKHFKQNFLTNKCLYSYKESKVLNMLHENMKVKKRPERFQDSTLEFDVILILDSNSRIDVVKGIFYEKETIFLKQSIFQNYTKEAMK